MKLLIKNHKDRHGKYDNQFHGSYVRIFQILEKDSLGFFQQWWEESFTKIEGTQNWILEIGGESIEYHQLEKILKLKNVEEV
jgi:hypothetical protein